MKKYGTLVVATAYELVATDIELYKSTPIESELVDTAAMTEMPPPPSEIAPASGEEDACATIADGRVTNTVSPGRTPGAVQ